MYRIYFICDWDGLCYVGKTKKSLNVRLSEHRSKKKRGQYCSSSKLDLYNCFIESIEECDKSQSKQIERYWINYIDCVNDKKLNHDKKQYRDKNKDKKKEYNKQYYQQNKDNNKDYYKQYRDNNKDKIKQYDKQYREYQNSWGGRYNNSLLNIDPYLFIY